MAKGIIFPVILCLFTLLANVAPADPSQQPGNPALSESGDVLRGKIICLDPGHGGTASKDSFRVGPTGEREEWINLRVALMLKEMLEKAGAKVIITRTEDIDVPLMERPKMAIDHGAELFISIHHNGTGAGRHINYPLIFFHDKASENPASVDFARILLKHFLENPYLTDGGLFSDKLIYATSGFGVIRGSYPVMPGVIGEYSFFSNPEEEQRLKQQDYNHQEAQRYLDALIKYFSQGLPTAILLNPEDKKEVAPSPPNPDPSFTQLPLVRLDDGLGSHNFAQHTFKPIIDGTEVSFEFDPATGILKLIPQGSLEPGRHYIRIFGRNIKGNALHPRKFWFNIK